MIKQLELFGLCDICEDEYTTVSEENFGYKTWWCDDCINSQEEKSYWDF